MSHVRDIPVRLGDRSYTVSIEQGGLDRAAERLGRFARGGRLIVVTDENVAATQLGRFQASFAGTAFGLHPIVLAPGEGSKSWATLAGLCDALLALGVERGDHIVALGGGVIGDLVGFATAILKRGCRYVQAPTSLLAQVDSSVGGKTAINTAAGKNLIGAFHQPAHVLIDPDTLDTLAARQVRAGYAEVVKYGLIGDPDFFAWCEASAGALLAGDPDARMQAIAVSVAAKAAIVAEDERETNDRRALLNLGHTFGHALEAEHGFGESLSHGEAVAAGMALAFRFSVSLGLCAADDAARASAHLAALGLPTTLAAARVDRPAATLLAHMMHDKKVVGGKLPLILVRGIGKAFVAHDIPADALTAFLEREREAA